MYSHCKLVILIVALTLYGQVHTGEIIGGHEAKPHSRPYMVLLEEHTQDNEVKYCDGFLLNEDFVMTAAHCQARSYTVFLGVHNFSSHNKIQSVSVQQAFPHKNYDRITYTNDIMLLKLNSKANFNKNVKPIALASQSDGSLPKSCIVSGWGDTGDKQGSPILMEVNVTITDNEQCAMENLYCSEGPIGPAKGDSGGPLVCEDGKAYGVVSFSVIPSPEDEQVYAYSKISDFRGWIDLTIKNAT